MKVNTILYIVGAVLILALILSVRSCRNLYDQNSVLKGREAELQRQVIERDAFAEAEILKYEAKINELNGMIDSSQTEIAHLEGVGEELAGTTADLEAARAKLTDKDEIIKNLDSQVATWKERFSIGQATIAEKDKIIFSLTAKYDAQVKITLEKDVQIRNRDTLLDMKDLRIAGLESELKNRAFWGKMKTVTLAGALGYVAVDVLMGMVKR